MLHQFESNGLCAMWNVKRRLRCRPLERERAVAPGLRYEKGMWACGCFGMTEKHCGKATHGSLVVGPNYWSDLVSRVSGK